MQFFKITLCFWDVIFQVGNKQEIGNWSAVENTP